MKHLARPPRLVLAWIGREGDSPLDATCEDYVRRIDRFVPALIRRIRPARQDDAVRIAEESRRLAEAARGASRVWLADREGDFPDSLALARWLSADLEGGKGPLVVLIGGAGGTDLSLRAQAHRRLSLSRLTFPHALARLLVAEQLYRALTLRENVPYHR